MKLKRLFVLSIVAMLCLSTQMVDVAAASFRASANKNLVKVGETFTVTISSSNYMIEGLSVSSSGCTIVSGISRLTLDDGETQTITAKLTSNQGATVTITGSGVDYDHDDVARQVSASVSVSAIKSTPKPQPKPNTNTNPKPSQTPALSESRPEVEPEKDTRSKDNDLKSLDVSEGKLLPKFDKEVTSYKVNLASTITSIKLSAKARDEKAKINGLGEKKLQAGTNTFKIEVVSEYGTKKVYTIQVYVDEKPLVYTTYKDQKLGVVRNIKGIHIPKNFKQTTTTLDGKSIPAWKNEKMKKTLVYLSDLDNNKAFYLFEDGKVTSKFETKKLLDREVYCVDITKEDQLDGFIFEPVKIDGVDFMGWTYKNPAFKNYQIVMVMDKDGQRRYYQHEKSENTLQLYTKSAPVTQEEWKKLQDETSSLRNSKHLWMGVSLLAVIFGIAGVAYITYKKK